MRRKLFTLTAGASAVLCAGVCVLWVRSYWVSDFVGRTTRAEAQGGTSVAGRYAGISSSRNAVGWVSSTVLIEGSSALYWSDKVQFFPKVLLGDGWEWVRSPLRTAGWRNFVFVRSRSEVKLSQIDWLTIDRTTFLVPHWLLAVVTAAGPGWLLTRMRSQRRKRRERLGLCPACGYDLRATPGRCPEGGAVPARPS